MAPKNVKRNRGHEFTLHWCPEPGTFVNTLTGDKVTFSTMLNIGPRFTGTHDEWNETLVEAVIDAANRLAKIDRTTDERTVIPADTVKVWASPQAFRLLQASVLCKPAINKRYTGKLCMFDVEEDATLFDTLVVDYDGKRTALVKLVP